MLKACMTRSLRYKEAEKCERKGGIAILFFVLVMIVRSKVRIGNQMKMRDRILKISILTVISLGLVCAMTSSFHRKDPLTKDQAIELAEQFVADNGYTNLPAEKSKLSYELFDESTGNADSILKYRYNTLQPKAFCIHEGTDRWDIGFLSVSVDLTKLDSVQRQTNLSGRAVIVSKNGKEIKMAHKDPLFSSFKKL